MEIRSILTAIWRRKLMILLSVIGGMVLAYLLVSQVPPRYTSRASVMLDPRSVQVMSSESVVSDLTLNDQYMATQEGVLRSNLLLKDVIAGFDDAQLAPIDPANDAPGMMSRLRGAIGAAKAALGLATPEPETAPAPEALTPEERRERRLIGALRRSMSVAREGRSYLINVAVETEDPVLSMQLTNAIVAGYLARQSEQVTATVVSATDFLQQRVGEMRQAVEDAEAAVEDYRIDQLASGGISAESLSQQLMNLSTQIATAEADLVTADARYSQIQTVIEEDGFPAAAQLLSSPFILSLREQQSVLQREDADLATRMAPTHPDRQRKRAEIELLERELTAGVESVVSTLRNDVAVAQIRLDSLRQSLNGLEERSADMSRASLELRQLEREAESARETYQIMQGRLNETRSIEEMYRETARVVEEATVAGAPSAPRTSLFTIFGGVLGLTGALLAAFALSMSGRGFSTPDQIERETGLPVMVTYPRGRWRGLRGMLTSLRAGPYQKFAERLRQTRTMLRYQRDGRQVRTVMVTSSVPGEGKTTLSVAMAHLEGVSGRSCVLLDFDARRSHLATEITTYAPRRGDLSDYVRGTSSLDDVLHHDDRLGFDLITVAHPMPQLADQADPARLKAIIDELSSRYDTVIIDTPPLLLVSDSMAMASVVDVVLLLVRQNTTRQRAVTESVRRLLDMGAGSIRIGMTMADPHRDQDAYGVTGQDVYGQA